MLNNPVVTLWVGLILGGLMGTALGARLGVQLAVARLLDELVQAGIIRPSDLPHLQDVADKLRGGRR